jgi:hypothetical protein
VRLGPGQPAGIEIEITVVDRRNKNGQGRAQDVWAGVGSPVRQCYTKIENT